MPRIHGTVGGETTPHTITPCSGSRIIRASAAQQYLAAGLVDEMEIHLVRTLSAT